MAKNKLPEVWLRGALPAIPPQLQPVAHALLQAQEELHEILFDFPDNLLWEKPAGVASVGFHLQHIRGVLDRLFTYAAGQVLNQDQMNALHNEGKQDDSITTTKLLSLVSLQINDSIKRLELTPQEILLETRTVGRAQLPSTVIGLGFHAAEHTMRHLGQLLVTVRILKDNLHNEEHFPSTSHDAG